jgi:hypothetical protein
VDNENGASFWYNHNYEQLISIGIVALPPQEPEYLLSQRFVPTRRSGQCKSSDTDILSNFSSDYRLKQVDVNGRRLKIVLQNENGPCPLIAIANVLALRNELTLEGKNDRISVDEICTKLMNMLRKQYTQSRNEKEKRKTTFNSFSVVANKPSNKTDMKDLLDRIEKMLPDLKVGLDVNFAFVGCDTFELSDKTMLFQLLKIRLVHGWLVDPIKNKEVRGSDGERERERERD